MTGPLEFERHVDDYLAIRKAVGLTNTRHGRGLRGASINRSHSSQRHMTIWLRGMSCRTRSISLRTSIDVIASSLP